MGDNLTSCDFNVGHSDLHPRILVDPKEANNNTTETALLLLENLCFMNSAKVKLKWLL